jgi:hypothetical protein
LDAPGSVDDAAEATAQEIIANGGEAVVDTNRLDPVRPTWMSLSDSVIGLVLLDYPQAGFAQPA